MIFVTGDIHGNARDRFNSNRFPEQLGLTKNDYLIICGDFGLIWDTEESEREKKELEWLEGRSFTTLFIDGNHENFDRLEKFEEKIWNNGKVHEIRPGVLHLTRGQVFEIDGKSVFTFGGARSQDISDGILESGDPRIKSWSRDPYKYFRIRNVSWWEREMPSREEMDEGLENLKKYGGKVDFIITHDMPSDKLVEYSMRMYGRKYNTDELTDYLKGIETNVDYEYWFCGHHHDDYNLDNKHMVLYRNIIKL